jgi:hypothetical protein
MQRESLRPARFAKSLVDVTEEVDRRAQGGAIHDFAW